MEKNKVVISLGGIYGKRLIRRLNPLELENPFTEWLGEPTLSGNNKIDHKTVIETEFDKPYWYNGTAEPGLNPYRSTTFREEEYFGNYLYALSTLVQCPVPYDRTEEFNTLNVHIDPIPKVPQNWNKTIEEVFLERAEEIWALDRPVRVWWSGGIDSTAVLISHLRTKKPEHELIVYMGDPCVEENPNFYETLKKMESNGELTIQWNDASNIWSFDNWNDGTINVTGEPGDPLYGTFVVEHHINEINSPWDDMFKWEDAKYVFKADDYRCNYHRPKFMEFTENFNKKCPFEIKTTFDFTWWLAFAIKWQWIAQRIYPQLDDPSNWQNMLPFYNSPDIQRWSIVNHDLKHKGSWKTYKWPSKEFIYDYNKDANYRDNKVKEKSIPKTAGMHFDHAQNHLIMTSGEYYKKIGHTEGKLPGFDIFTELEPKVEFLDKRNVYNKQLSKQWQKML